MVLEGLKAKLRRWGRQLCYSLLLLLYAGWPACLTPPLRYRLVFGMLYPAYASYKTVKTKNSREYVSRVPGQLLPGLQPRADRLTRSPQVRWMMYWIVFALFMATETITDLLISW